MGTQIGKYIFGKQLWSCFILKVLKVPNSFAGSFLKRTYKIYFCINYRENREQCTKRVIYIKNLSNIKDYKNCLIFI